MTTTPKSALFSDLPLIEPLQKAIQATGYTTPTPIQLAAIPHLLAGKDLLGCAQTGTGKTAAFALPMIQKLVKDHRMYTRKQPRALILTPTRELALQIFESFQTYGRHTKLKYAVIFGGVGQTPQVHAVANGVDVLVATPGRLLDLIQQRHLSLESLEIFVLDEADRMLDMGFIHDIRRVIQMLPKKRQNLFFSATMPPEIVKLSSSMLVNPEHVTVTPPSSTVEMIQQSLMFVEHSNKRDLLRTLLQDKAMSKVIVFTRTKHGANRVLEVLVKNKIPTEAIHGNKSQNARVKALENFREGRVRVLVATDIAARGIDIDNISHVINFEIPNIAESYVHRIGRTARAGTDGIAISFCDLEEKAFIRDIEKLIKISIPINRDQPYHSEAIEHGKPMAKGKAKAAVDRRGDHQHRGGGRNQRGRHGGGGRPQSSAGPRQGGQSEPRQEPRQHATGPRDHSHRDSHRESGPRRQDPREHRSHREDGPRRERPSHSASGETHNSFLRQPTQKSEARGWDTRKPREDRPRKEGDERSAAGQKPGGPKKPFWQRTKKKFFKKRPQA